MKKDWESKKLGDIAEIIYGYTEKASFEKIGPKFLRITDIQNNDVNWDSVPFCKIENSDYLKYILNKDDIVFARTGATTGKSYLIKDPPKSIFASYLIKVHLKDTALLPKFIYLYFQTNKYWDLINAGISGSAQGGFNATKLADLQIPLPPLPEQKRIVKILDEAFSAIEKANENAEKNLKNSWELFNSYLQSVFAKPGKDWEEKTLGEVSKISYGFTEKASQKEIGPKFLRITDIQNNNVEWGSVPYCKCGKEEFKKYLLFKGDIVFARTGATTGKSYLIKNPPESVYASYLIRLQILYKKKLLPEFTYYYFQSESYWSKIKAGVSGSAQGGFNASKLACLNINYPQTINEQKFIISKLNNLSQETKKLELIYNQKLTDLEELKKSILQKAFSGEL